MGRQSRLLQHNMYGVTKIEVLGPYSDSEALKLEYDLIQEHADTVVNKIGHPTNRAVKPIGGSVRKSTDTKIPSFSTSPTAIKKFLKEVKK